MLPTDLQRAVRVHVVIIVCRDRAWMGSCQQTLTLIFTKTRSLTLHRKHAFVEKVGRVR